MRKNLGVKPLVYPMPVFIIASYDADDVPNAMNAAWGGISGENRITVCVDRGHKTIANILARRAFTVSMATEETVAACDYVGIVSGNKVPGKFAKAGFHEIRSANVDAPIIRELPLALECVLVGYDDESEVLVGEIVNVSAEESVMTDGKVDVAKLKPIVYDTAGRGYYSMTVRVGSAFSDGRKLL